MRRYWVLGLVLLALFWLVLAHRVEARHVLDAFRQGRADWLLVAALLQGVFYLWYTGVYHLAFRLVGVDSRLLRLLPVVFASFALNVVVAGSGAVLFVNDAVRRGQSGARAAGAVILVRAADFATFAVVLLAAFAFLYSHHELHSYELVAGGGLVLVIAGWGGLLVLGLVRPGALRRGLEVLRRLADKVAGRLRRPSPLAADWAERSTHEFAEAAASCSSQPGRLAGVLLTALVAHGVDLLSLAALFRAFGQPIGAGALVAGFAVGILFWIVAVTPQGIGVVEGAMALLYTSLGVPAATATAVALAFRGLTFWLPMLLGFLWLPRSVVPAEPAAAPELEPTHWLKSRRRHWRVAWPVRLAAGWAALVGMVNVASAVTPSLSSRLAVLDQFLPVHVRRGGHLTAALAGFALLLLSTGLLRRKKAAWAGAVVVLIVSVFSHLIKGLDYEETLTAAVLLLYLVLFRDHFTARSDRASGRQGAQVLLGAFGFTLLYGVIGFFLLDHHFKIDFGFRAAVRQTVVMFTEFYDPGLEPITGFGRWFARSIYLVGASTGGYALLMLLRPVLFRGPATDAERERAAAIVQAHGRSGLARFTLFDDKAYWFSGGGSVIAYVVKGRIALVLADPIGPADDIPAAITAFRDHCARNDWAPAFYETGPDHLEAYLAAGLTPLCIGHDAVVDLPRFTIEGKAGRNLRTPLNRLTKTGHTARMNEPPMDQVLLEELRDVSDEWLMSKHGNEKHFALGWFDDDYLRGSRVMTVHGPEGEVTAFANVVPEYQLNGLTVDLMRHRGELEPGTMDFLFVSLLQWSKEHGYDTFNLGLSSLSGVGDRSSDPAIERALHVIYEHVDRYYNFKGLHQFKSKFHPRWEPRYLVHPGLARLPAVWTAIMRANGGDDFLSGYLRR